MTDEEIRKLAGEFISFIAEAKEDRQEQLLVLFGQEVERRTRQRAFSVAIEAVNRIDDREYRAK